MNRKQITAVENFHLLHESGCFVLPNPWDAGSAIYLEHIGFKAVATTSAGFAFTKGLPDEPELISRDLMLGHFREIVEATSLPVNADFQNGFADDPEGVAESVRLCLDTGVAGLSIEDNSGQREQPLYDFDLAVERIKAARSAIDHESRRDMRSVPPASAGGSTTRVLLTARCEAYLVGDSDPFNTSIERLVAFADAGADCLYAPGLTQLEEISAIVGAVAPKPVNILVSTNNCNVTVSQLADLGVRRISVGGALARAAWGGFVNAAKQIHERGSFASFADATPFGELNDLFAERAKTNRS